MTWRPLQRAFFLSEPLLVARRLLGQRLIRRLHGDLLVGRIVEVEAYGGLEDSTSHAIRGVDSRAAGMFGEVGRAYVYLIYGMHSCLNVVAHAEGGVGAILIRALAPEVNVERMRALRRDIQTHLIASGPGRLCSALAIDRSFDDADLCDPSGALFLAAGSDVPDSAVASAPRIGVGGGPEDIVRPWRLYVRDDPNVSPGRRWRRGRLPPPDRRSE